MHYKVVCKHCDAVYQQCRCPSPDKAVALGVCPKCLDKPLGEVIAPLASLGLSRSNMMKRRQTGAAAPESSPLNILTWPKTQVR
jgi:hypothetical protein